MGLSQSTPVAQQKSAEANTAALAVPKTATTNLNALKLATTYNTATKMRRNNENNLRGGKRTKKQKRKGGKKSRCWSRRA